MPLVSFYTPWKHQFFLRFQGVLKEASGMKWVKHKSRLFKSSLKLVQPFNLNLNPPLIKQYNYSFLKMNGYVLFKTLLLLVSDIVFKYIF